VSDIVYFHGDVSMEGEALMRVIRKRPL